MYRNDVLNCSTSETTGVESIQLIREQLFQLQTMKKEGNIKGVDIAINDLKRKEFEEKERKVLEIHKNKITQTTEKKRGKLTPCWQTRCKGLGRPRRKTYEELINVLYDFYFDSKTITDCSFRNIFNAALENKMRTEQPKEKTIRDYHDSYKAWIDKDFGDKDIRRIKPSELNAYILKKVMERNPTKEYFRRFKGLLNLVFEFACAPERRIIEFNPVPKNNKAFAKYYSISSNKPEDKAFQPDEVELIRKHLWERVEEEEYDVYGYAILFSSRTGVREGEIPSLKWEDVKRNAIHIHSQQNDERRDGKRVYYYNPTTKEEKGVSRGGRFTPLTSNIRKILQSLKAKQDALGINSEWVFCKRDGTWILYGTYAYHLRKECKKLGLNLTNNHAFRMYLNSYVYCETIDTNAERGAILGHSPETNLRNYTFARSDDYMDELCRKIDAFEGVSEEENSKNTEEMGGTSRNLTIIPFPAKKKNALYPL